MTAFLASVRDGAEVEIAIAAGADILDLKDPASGALGALSLEAARRMVARIAGRRPVSATVGDLPMHPRTIADAVEAMSRTGVDMVKVGLFAQDGAAACIGALGSLARRGVRVVLVGFADRLLAPAWVAAARRAGLHGVMLDTADKGGGSLGDVMAPADISAFVHEARRAGLMVGLAGSLRPDDIGPLLFLKPDVLGFRGALCRVGRDGQLQREACDRIRRAIPETEIAFTARVA